MKSGYNAPAVYFSDICENKYISIASSSLQALPEVIPGPVCVWATQPAPVLLAVGATERRLSVPSEALQPEDAWLPCGLGVNHV